MSNRLFYISYSNTNYECLNSELRCMIGDPKNLMKPPYRVQFFEFEKFDTGFVINDPENTLTPLF